jgi:hypothetical protein
MISSWRVDLVAAFLVSWVRAFGWCPVRVVRARTGSVYLYLSCGVSRAVLRVADHPPGRNLSARVYWLRVPSLASSLSAVPAFLAYISSRVASASRVPLVARRGP